MNKYLRSFFRLEKNGSFLTLFEDILEVRSINPYLQTALNCPF